MIDDFAAIIVGQYGPLLLDLATVRGLVLISAAVAALIEVAKIAGLDDLLPASRRRAALRVAAVALGLAAVLAWLGPGVMQVAVGILAGFGAESVYRVVVRPVVARLRPPAR